ncbi:ABC transporter ATP-binding protein [Rhodobacter lacus]|uniref:ABC transporter ATP-binding protein n=1 Tax=Rhodobacter lacus TaxID=1641972 RepID=A0ABW5A752_9RHOB
MQISPLPSAPEIRCESLSRGFEAVRALDNVSITLPGGQFSVLLGPSGCGKSTLLRLIAGLDAPSAGVVRIGGRDMGGVAPVGRGLSMVFQSYALFPHLSVAENILFGLSVRRVGRAEQAERLARVAEMMGLGALLARKPAALSGGQQQRVALARAVISERPICLMDEPLSNLDARLRAEMRVELRALQRRLGLSVVYVTHDQTEAMTMADQIVVLNAGRVEQLGRPEEIYTRPETAFVARFIGLPPMNILPLVDLGEAELDGAGGLVPQALPRSTLAGLRPEALRVAPAGTHTGLPVRRIGQEYLGADLLLRVATGGATLVMRLPAAAPPPPERFSLTWAPDALHLFAADTGRRLTFPPNPSFAPSERTLP